MNEDYKGLAEQAFSENPGGDLDGCGTFLGHHEQYESWQNGLKKLILRAKEKGCTYNPEADVWASKWAPLWPKCWD